MPCRISMFVQFHGIDDKFFYHIKCNISIRITKTMRRQLPIRGFSEKSYDFPKKTMIFREKLWFYEKNYDFTKKTMIFREKLWFSEKNYDFTKKTMIFREKLWFSEKNYDFPKKAMIFREKLWFSEKIVSRKIIAFFGKS